MQICPTRDAAMRHLQRPHLQRVVSNQSARASLSRHHPARLPVSLLLQKTHTKRGSYRLERLQRAGYTLQPATDTMKGGHITVAVYKGSYRATRVTELIVGTLHQIPRVVRVE